MVDEKAVTSVGETIDKATTLDITSRGVIHGLHRATREILGYPPVLQAARLLTERVHKKDVVIIASGMPVLPWLSGEQDGPIGAATLAKALVLGLLAKPLIVTEPSNADLMRTTIKAAGLQLTPLERFSSLPAVAAVVEFPLEMEDAVNLGRMLLDRYEPKALIAIERAGANEKGHYHSAMGRDLTPYSAKIDPMFEEARSRGILTIGIGDGGNELGCGLIRKYVIENIPRAKQCQCPCGGSTVPRFVPDVLITAAVSNWGAYGLEACLAFIQGDIDILHTPELEMRVQRACAEAGANNDGPGFLDPGADFVPPPIHAALIEVMRHAVKSGFDFGRVYRIPRYPWLE